MERALPEDASYRDPAGRVYLLGDRILRSVTSVGAADFEFLRGCGLLDDLTRDGRLIGSTEVERKALRDRANADGISAPASIHHLTIGRNLPLKEVVDWLIDLAPQGVIEFVEKDDPCVRPMLRFRSDIFPDYRRETFRAAVLTRAEIVEEQEITANRRLLVWYDRRDD